MIKQAIKSINKNDNSERQSEVNKKNLYAKLPIGAALTKIHKLSSHKLINNNMTEIDLNESLKVFDVSSITIKSIERCEVIAGVEKIIINGDKSLMFDPNVTFNWSIGDILAVDSTIIGDEYLATKAALEINRTNYERIENFKVELEAALYSIEQTIQVQENKLESINQ